MKNVNQRRKYSNADLMDKLIDVLVRQIAAYTQAEKEAKQYIIDVQKSRKNLEKIHRKAINERRKNATE